MDELNKIEEMAKRAESVDSLREVLLNLVDLLKAELPSYPDGYTG